MVYKVVIPARANSKRLSGKNMKLLGGKPLVGHSIDFALKSFKSDSIWVNSNDIAVLKYAKGIGVKTLERPNQLATDNTTTVEVLKFHLKYFEENKIKCDAIILLQPTNPLRNDNLMRNAIKSFENSGRESLASFSKSRLKLGTIDKHQKYSPYNYIPGDRSQDLNDYFFENGQIYITKSKSILNGYIITEDVYPLICDNFEATIDIDYQHDLQIANLFI